MGVLKPRIKKVKLHDNVAGNINYLTNTIYINKTKSKEIQELAIKHEMWHWYMFHTDPINNTEENNPWQLANMTK